MAHIASHPPLRAGLGADAENGRSVRDTVAFSTPPMQQWRLRSEDRAGHNASLTCLYSCAGREKERDGRRETEGWGVHGRPCNLVIDQFVTIWRFVCTGPVNCVYSGPDDRRVSAVCLGAARSAQPSSPRVAVFCHLARVSVSLRFSSNGSSVSGQRRNQDRPFRERIRVRYFSGTVSLQKMHPF